MIRVWVPPSCPGGKVSMETRELRPEFPARNPDGCRSGQQQTFSQGNNQVDLITTANQLTYLIRTLSSVRSMVPVHFLLTCRSAHVFQAGARPHLCVFTGSFGFPEDIRGGARDLPTSTESNLLMVLPASDVISELCLAQSCSLLQIPA